MNVILKKWIIVSQWSICLDYILYSVKYWVHNHIECGNLILHSLISPFMWDCKLLHSLFPKGRVIKGFVVVMLQWNPCLPKITQQMIMLSGLEQMVPLPVWTNGFVVGLDLKIEKGNVVLAPFEERDRDLAWIQGKRVHRKRKHKPYSYHKKLITEFVGRICHWVRSRHIESL